MNYFKEKDIGKIASELSPASKAMFSIMLCILKVMYSSKKKEK